MHQCPLYCILYIVQDQIISPNGLSCNLASKEKKPKNVLKRASGSLLGDALSSSMVLFFLMDHYGCHNLSCPSSLYVDIRLLCG